MGEIYGYRRVYLAGLALFTAASAACALSGSLPVLTAARIVQGFGAAGLMSVNAALLRYIIPQARFGTAVGFNALVVAGAASVGPTFAGFMLTWLDWPWLFAINVPIGAAVVAAGLFTLPASDLAKRRFDWKSAGLCAASIGLFVILIDSIGHELPPVWIAAELLGFIVAAMALVRRELGRPDPLLPLDLLKLPIFALSVGTSIASFTAQMLAFVSAPFLLQTILGFAPAQVGMLLMPWPLATAVMAPIAGRLSDRHSPAILGGAGLGMLSAGLALLALLPADPAVADIVWRMALCGAGFALFQAPNNRTLITSAPKVRSGAASGMLGTARLTGQTVGAALVALLMARLGVHGAFWALGLASVFAGLAAAISLTRYRLFAEQRREAEVADASDLP